MRLLVITQSYPDADNIYAAGFIHTRHLYYLKQKAEVSVVSFSCKVAYEHEGVKVYPANRFEYLIKANNFAAIICHAPNLRNHLRLIMPRLMRLPKIFFIFHGHEMLHKSHYYPKPYPYQQSKWQFLIQLVEKAYDYCKCFALRQIIKRYGGKKIFLIFVSNYLQKLFADDIGLAPESTAPFSCVINNPIHPVFIEKSYDSESTKDFDFITIRPFDKPVYALDIILKMARQNPDRSFHIYGQGQFFKHNYQPANVKVIERFIAPFDIPALLNRYKAALMPSWHDSQGVMACEMAAYGIPLIVSDIPAAREMLEGISNVAYIENNAQRFDLDMIVANSKQIDAKQLKAKFSPIDTADKELKFISEVSVRS